ncbi:zinc-binding metallopeptidase family protein [Mycoplasmopsis felifaucium]|uniref:M42 family peptidase n=1 Tax=Mycoplasmopsis felifaucium TaxID=35768 RepID=UPI000487CF7C|nr:M42 family peptidase [Mycoplasmopsis felifaucium]
MTKEIFKEKLITYLELEGMSRNEQAVAKALVNSVNTNIYEVSYDNFGSAILYKKSKDTNAPKFMVAAHMDEVGFIVKSIEPTGHIKLDSVGGIWPNVVIGTKASLINSKGVRYEGVFGHTSIHIMEAEKVKQAVTLKDLYADFGFLNKEDALNNNVEVGNLVLMSGETIRFANNDLIGGKAMDNRAGVCVLEHIAKELENIDLGVDLYLVGTTQEEVGTRGAKTSLSLINPDFAIALDTTSSHDTPGCIQGTTQLTKGAALRIMDRGMMANPKLVEFMCEIGRNNKIDHYKFVAMGGGTDAAELQYAKGGAITLTVSLPQRYLHSPIGVCSIDDLISATKLITETIKAINSEVYGKIFKYN